jgi:hypothetical protein
MSDVADAGFSVTYPRENVFGVGIAGPAVPEATDVPPEPAPPEQPQGQSRKVNEELGRYVDVKI